MSKDYFSLIQKFRGFRTKTDKTKLRSGYLVDGSQNVLSTDSENIKIREGYSVDGTESSDNTPITSSFDWETHNGYSRYLRAYSNTLEYRYNDDWHKLNDGYTNETFRFAIYWDTNEIIDMLLYVNGDTNVYAWSGGVTEIASTTSNSITKTGTTTWAEDRFITAGTDYDKKVIINGTTYTYTGGETTDTLTGVTPDPTGEADGSIVVQQPTTFADLVGSGYNINLIATFRNQVYYGSSKRREIHISQVNDFNNFSQTSPRLPGEGASITLDDVPRGFVPQEDNIYISAGKSHWYQVAFSLADDLQKESVAIQRLKSGIGEGAASQEAITRMKNKIVFLSNEPTIDFLGRIQSFDTPQSVPISDPIKPTLDAYDTTGATLTYFRNRVFVAVPQEGVVLIYNLERGYWEAPQVLPVNSFSIIDNELHGHSNATKNTYKLFTGHNDNGNVIDARAKFSYMSYGKRAALKAFDEFYIEGYISSNTNLEVDINYEYQGSEGTSSFEITGNDTDILFATGDDVSLGKKSLGKEPLGSSINSSDELVKFRTIQTMPKKDFYEKQIVVHSNQEDANWEVLAFGANTTASVNKAISIKK